MNRDPNVRPPTRRRFIGLAVGGVAAASGAGVAFAWVTRTHYGARGKLERLLNRLRRAAYEDLPLATLVARHFDYLLLEPGSAERFATEYAAWRGGSEREAVDRILDRFLLSTDFFLHAADEGRPVRYLHLYDPYSRPCANPFFRRAPPR